MSIVSPTPNNPRRTEDALQRATAAVNQGRLAEAEQVARGVLGSEPKNAVALHLLGTALLLQDRPADAIEPLEGAVRVLRDSSVDTRLAMALRLVGRTDDALSRLKRATKREPPHAAAFHELGYLLFTLRRYDEALAVVRRGIEIAPITPELWVLLGGIGHARRDLPDAKAAYARALSISPNLPAAHYGMGAVLMEEAAFAQAAEHLRFASMSDPADLQARLKLGGCLLELGQPDAAMACLRAGVRAGLPKAYGMSLRVLVSAGQGRFWLRPSRAGRSLD